MDIQLSQKERMLLEDQKTHEQVCIEKYQDYAQQATDNQLKQIFNANGQVEHEHLNSINQLLGGTIPQTGGQQGQSQSQGAGQAAGGQQGAGSQGGTKTGTAGSSAANRSDKDMCSDMLMTEKYVSGAYDTTIFEFQDTRVRDVLNHIQKEEQKHGEAISQYMISKGLYQPQ
jgi:spore coat protein CotF